MLIGRGSERAELDALLEQAAAGSGGSLLLRGEPGIGKSALLDYAAAQAVGFRVLRAAGVESESELAFSALHELLIPVIELADTLPPPQRGAILGAFALAPPAGAGVGAIAAATLGLFALAAEREPLLCLVDDVHWTDAASTQALAFVARRLRLERVAVVCAVRRDSEVRWEGVRELAIAPLERESAAALLDRAAGAIAPDVADRLLDAAGGNPLGILELPTALSSSQLAGLAPLAEPLVTTRRLETTFLRRARTLSPATRAALIEAAAADVRLPASAGLAEAEAAGLVELDSGRVAFRHPLVRSAVYGDATAEERRTAHAAVAARLDPEQEPDRQAWHRALAAIGPDETIAENLERTAARARQRGGVLAEARALEKAADLSVDPASRAVRLAGAASAAHDAGHRDHAWDLAEQALVLTDDPLVRADVQGLRVDILYWQGDADAARQLAAAEVDAVRPHDPARAARILNAMGLVLSQRLESADALEVYQRAHTLVHEPRPIGPSHIAHTLLRLGRFEEGRSWLARAAGLEEAVGPTGAAVEISWSLTMTEEYDRARTIIERAIVAHRRNSALAELAFSLNGLVYLETRVGRLAAAHAAGTESVQLSAEIGGRVQQSSGLGRLATVEALLGLDDEARLHAGQALAAAEPIEARRIVAETRHALALVELTGGDAEAAVEQLEATEALLRPAGVGEPGFVPFGADLVEAYVRAGRPADAETALERFEEQATLSGRRWALAAAARCSALLGRAGYEVALALHEQDRRPLERARTQLLAGEQLRRSGQRVAARNALRSALSELERLGARPLAERARTELAASGERLRAAPDAREELTPQELQVATIVARGASNKEAAGQLFLSPKTIEFHLRNAYRKLGVTSRTQLANVLRERVEV